MLRIEILKGLLGQVSSAGPITLDQVGISDEDFETTVSPIPWSAPNRRAVSDTIEQLIFGSMDLAGLPRFETPAEYQAAVIAFYVAPVNWLSAARLVEGGKTAEDLGANGAGEREKVSAAQIFGLMCLLTAADITGARHVFEKRSKVKFDKYMQGAVKAA